LSNTCCGQGKEAASTEADVTFRGITLPPSDPRDKIQKYKNTKIQHKKYTYRCVTHLSNGMVKN